MDSTFLVGQLAKLFENSESADVALHCAGQVIKAHSAILAMRSPYFKTAIGIQNQLEVKECSPEVLSTFIKFIYGISLPEDLSVGDAKDLLTIADLYLMEDLKEALAPVLGAQLDKDSILEISRMAEKFTAPKLMEICADFIVSNITDPGELFAGMPQIAALCFKKQHKKLEIANVALQPTWPNLKKQNYFPMRDGRGVLVTNNKEYKDFLMRDGRGVLVTNNKTLYVWYEGVYKKEVEEGSIGRILRLDSQLPSTRLVYHRSDTDTDGARVDVMWFLEEYVTTVTSISLLDLDICGPPFNTTFL